MSNAVYIIDAMNYIFRAYHALPDDIRSPSGLLTNAVLGYLRTLLRIIKERKPQYMVAAFEAGSSFRAQVFSEYKANRPARPQDLEPQFGYCRRITKAIGVPCFEMAGYEADDIIGTIASKMSQLGHPIIIVTGDKDMSQLVCGTIRIYDIARDMWFDETAVRERFGVAPGQIPDLLALHGDSVDNIPGVRGVGPKTARQILSVYTTIEDLIEQPPEGKTMNFRGRDEILRRIRQNIETVRMSRKLATICCEAPFSFTSEELRYRSGDRRMLEPLCAELGFQRVLEDIPLAQPRLF